MTSFYERQKSLFNTLKDAEEQYSFSKSNKASESQDYGVIDKQSYRKLKREMKQFRGRESIYKRQDANIRECLRAKTVPQYMKDPQNWVYYSLSDVTPDQMSESTNTATALAFIREMEERDSDKFLTVTDETGAVFKKPMFQISKTIKPNVDVEEKVMFKSSKIIMPEYVVGVTRNRGKKQTNKKTDKIVENSDNEKRAELKLNHLFDAEEDCISD
ncbi:uncharacterized protein LOC119828305 isoform X2 [Zerene cesonia]|uniref:uncharacterized protein LOC119828305 isoform X1 n=1 Tax=Zerene cesonia TaxID=33412 RepID=UPI0018E50CD6|nr:uncharacterized protein LOC119828305 isoform X1 [Zerene cesonia]XP_038206355.1 uncharacterized protein LOC119828305 isoform X2 [Zerene cesonia]